MTMFTFVCNKNQINVEKDLVRTQRQKNKSFCLFLSCLNNSRCTGINKRHKANQSQIMHQTFKTVEVI